MTKMSSSNAAPTFKQAKQLFQSGEFKRAHTMYQQLGSVYGAELVRANLYLCEKNLSVGNSETVKLPVIAKDNVKGGAEVSSVDLQATLSQLDETQALLEKYYIEAQQLKYQQMDVQAA